MGNGWCSCGNWLLGSEHSCPDCEEPDWKAHNDCGHNRLSPQEEAWEASSPGVDGGF